MQMIKRYLPTDSIPLKLYITVAYILGKAKKDSVKSIVTFYIHMYLTLKLKNYTEQSWHLTGQCHVSILD